MLTMIALLAAPAPADERANLHWNYKLRGMSDAGAQTLLAAQDAKCALRERQLSQLRAGYARLERARDAKPFDFIAYERERRAHDALNNRLTVEATEAELAQFRRLTSSDRAVAVTFVGYGLRCPNLDGPPAPPPPPRP